MPSAWYRSVIDEKKLQLCEYNVGGELDRENWHYICGKQALAEEHFERDRRERAAKIQCAWRRRQGTMAYQLRNGREADAQTARETKAALTIQLAWRRRRDKWSCT